MEGGREEVDDHPGSLQLLPLYRLTNKHNSMSLSLTVSETGSMHGKLLRMHSMPKSMESERKRCEKAVGRWVVVGNGKQKARHKARGNKPW